MDKNMAENLGENVDKNLGKMWAKNVGKTVCKCNVFKKGMQKMWKKCGHNL